MSEKIMLEMTREQARAVMDATELLSRLEIGQFKEICWKMLDRFNGEDGFDSHRRDQAESYLDAACMTVFGTDEHGRPKIGGKSIQHKRAGPCMRRFAMRWRGTTTRRAG